MDFFRCEFLKFLSPSFKITGYLVQDFLTQYLASLPRHLLVGLVSLVTKDLVAKGLRIISRSRRTGRKGNNVSCAGGTSQPAPPKLEIDCAVVCVGLGG